MNNTKIYQILIILILSSFNINSFSQDNAVYSLNNRNELKIYETEDYIQEFQYDANGNRIREIITLKKPIIDVSTNNLELGKWDATCNPSNENGFYVRNLGNKKLILTSFNNDNVQISHSFIPNDTIQPLDSFYYSVNVNRLDTFSVFTDTIYISGYQDQDTFVVITSYPPEPALTLITNMIQPVCVGGSLGQLGYYASGGKPPYSYYVNYINASGSNTINVSNPGWYFVEVYDNFNCTISDSIYIGIEGPQIELGDTIFGCGEVTITASSEFDNFLWSTGSTDQSITVSSQGIYWIQADSGGCEATDSVFVSLTDYSVRNVSANICANQNYILPNGQTVNTQGIYTDTIAGNECDSVIITQLSVNPLTNGQINVSICPNDSYTMPLGEVVTEQGVYIDTIISNNCDSVVTVNLSVLPAQTFPAFVSNNNDLVVNFSNTSGFGNTYLWDFGDGNQSTSNEPQHTYPNYGSYLVCLTSYADCDTAQFCRDIQLFDPNNPCNRNLDSLTLLSVYNSTNGLGWVDPWNTNLSINFCNGALLSGQGCVAKLLLMNRNLDGNLPNDISNLNLVEEINLNFNSINGSIPNLNNLRIFRKAIPINKQT
ncbi:MAG: PKD domain-containing protein [Chitinophagales bacterium]